MDNKDDGANSTVSEIKTRVTGDTLNRFFMDIGSDRMNHERLIYIYTNLLGSAVDILMKDRTVYNGVFFAVGSKEKCIVLRYATIQMSSTPVDQLSKDFTLIIPQEDIVMIRAKKVRFLSYTNSSFLDANRLRMGFGAFDPTRPLPRNLVSLPRQTLLPIPDTKMVTSGDMNAVHSKGDAQRDIAIPSLEEAKSKPKMGFIAPFPPIRPDMLRNMNHPVQTVPKPRPLTREQQIAEFKKFSEEFNKKYGVTLKPRKMEETLKDKSTPSKTSKPNSPPTPESNQRQRPRDVKEETGKEKPYRKENQTTRRDRRSFVPETPETGSHSGPQHMQSTSPANESYGYRRNDTKQNNNPSRGKSHSRDTPGEQTSYQSTTPQQFSGQSTTPGSVQMGPQPMLMNGMPIMPQGSDMQMTWVTMMAQDGSLVMQPVIIQNNQMFPVNIPMLYGMNQGFNYSSLQGMPMMQQQNMMYSDTGMGFMMPGVQSNSSLQGLHMQQIPGVQTSQNMSNLPIQQLSGMPVMMGIPQMQGMPIQQVPGVTMMPGSSSASGMQQTTPSESIDQHSGQQRMQASPSTPGVQRATARRTPGRENDVDENSVIEMLKHGDETSGMYQYTEDTVPQDMRDSYMGYQGMGRPKPYRQQRDRSGNQSTQQHRNPRGPRYGQRDNSNYSEGTPGDMNMAGRRRNQKMNEDRGYRGGNHSGRYNGQQGNHYTRSYKERDSFDGDATRRDGNRNRQREDSAQQPEV